MKVTPEIFMAFSAGICLMYVLDFLTALWDSMTDRKWYRSLMGGKWYEVWIKEERYHSKEWVKNPGNWEILNEEDHTRKPDDDFSIDH